MRINLAIFKNHKRILDEPLFLAKARTQVQKKIENYGPIPKFKYVNCENDN